MIHLQHIFTLNTPRTLSPGKDSKAHYNPRVPGLEYFLIKRELYSNSQWLLYCALSAKNTSPAGCYQL